MNLRHLTALTVTTTLVALPVALGALTGPADAAWGAVGSAPSSHSTASADAVPTCAGRPATIYGPSDGQDDPLVGTEGDDVMVVTGDITSVEGLGGDDLICGGDGYDTIDAGPGDDTVHAGGDLLVDDEDGSQDYYDDVVDGGTGSDLIHLGGRGGDVSFGSEPAGVTLTLTAHGARKSASAVTSTGTDTVATTRVLGVYGSPFSDHLTGSTLDDGLDGGAGADVVDGEDGNDYLSGGEGADVVHGGPGDDRLDDGHRVTFTGADDDELYGGQGDDLLLPETGADVVDGGPGDDTFDLSTVSDLAAGTVITGDSGDDAFTHVDVDRGVSLRAGTGHDTLHALFVATKGSTKRPVVDLARGTWSATTGSAQVSLSSFERVLMEQLGHFSGSGLFIGSTRQESITSRLDAPLVAHAGGGDDVLRGSGFPDRLDGGAGHDVGYGGGGHDTCRSIERRHDC